MDFELELLSEFKDCSDFEKDNLIKILTFNEDIIPVLIKGSLDVYDGNISIEFNNGDKIYHEYRIDPTGHNDKFKSKFTLKINDKDMKVNYDQSNGLLEDIIENYNTYLNNKENPLGLSCINALLGLKSTNPDLAETGLSEITEMMGLIDGAYEAVELYKSDSPYNNNIWKPNWLKLARKYGASSEW